MPFLQLRLYTFLLFVTCCLSVLSAPQSLTYPHSLHSSICELQVLNFLLILLITSFLASIFCLFSLPCIEYSLLSLPHVLHLYHQKRAERSHFHHLSRPLITRPFEGQTYDRSSIEKWLAAGNLTCPVTMQKLHDQSIVPNHTLRHLIDQWLQMGEKFDPNYLATIDRLAALKQDLECHEGALEEKLQTLQRVRVLSEESPSANSCLLQLNFLPLLLNLVFGNVKAKLSINYIKFVDLALSCAISLLPFGELESLNMLKGESKFASFLDLFEHGTATVKISLCHLIEAISLSSETRELYATLGKTRQLLHEAVLLVGHGSEASEAAVKAVAALSSLEPNREHLIREGAVDGLIKYILGAEGREKNLAPVAMETLEKLLEVESAKEALVNNPDGVAAIVKMVFRVSDHEGSESAVGLLTTLCCDSLRVREEAISAGVLTQLLLLLQSQCNGRTKTKARMLLKLLRSKWAEDSKHT